jgi:hypothetical protein
MLIIPRSHGCRSARMPRNCGLPGEIALGSVGGFAIAVGGPFTPAGSPFLHHEHTRARREQQQRAGPGGEPQREDAEVTPVAAADLPPFPLD